jgi:hypothetical protein
MPPKKTTPVAAQKCGRCFKKHAPPLGDQCLALLLGEPGSVTNSEQEDEFVNNSNSVDAHAAEAELQGAVGGPLPEKDQGNGAVAAQLANLTAVVSHLAGLFEVTRTEVSSLRSEVAAERSAQTVTKNNSAAASGAPATAPVMAMSVPAAAVSVSNIVSSGNPANVSDPAQLIPSLASLRADAGLVNQAEQLVSSIGESVTGNCFLNSSKRGSVRCGGDLRPSVRVPWPQDYILGSGSRSKVYYEDLSIYEWVNGYIAIVQLQDPVIAIHMLVHLRNLMEDAVFHCWDTIKQAHSTILSCLETGEITWTDEFAMADKRRSAITRASRPAQSQNFNTRSRQFQQGNHQNRQQFNSGSVSNKAGGVIKKLFKPCVYYNNGVCSKKSDHDEGNVFYRHICSHCMASDHVVKQCNFL